MKLLIDSDAIEFMAAAQADGRMYRVGGVEFKYKKDAVGYANDMDIDVGEVELSYVPEPDSHACQCAKKLVESVITVVTNETGRIVEPVFVMKHSDPDLQHNFRYDVDDSYKANRKDVRIPHHIKTVNEFLKKRHHYKYSVNEEVDDRLGILQMEDMAGGEHVMIASHDKDLDLIPGMHCRIKRGGAHTVYEVNEAEADTNFYMQMLTGDTVDNIPGIKGIGPKKAAKILEGIEGDNTAMWNAVVKAYLEDAVARDMDDVDVDIVHMDMMEDALTDILIDKARLLWIRREEGEMWNPPPPFPPF